MIPVFGVLLVLLLNVELEKTMLGPLGIRRVDLLRKVKVQCKLLVSDISRKMKSGVS